MNSLYEIGREYQEAFERLEIDEETGEILNFEALDALSGQFDDKAESVACYIKNQAALAAALKSEEDALASRRKRTDRQVDSLKKYLSTSMTAVGKDKIETPRCRLSFRKSVSVQITDEKALPTDFIKITEERKPDKTAIKEAIQGGQEVAGASLVENRNIQIK